MTFVLLKLIHLICSITGFEPSHTQHSVTDTFATVEGVEEEAGHTSVESLVVSFSSDENETDHDLGVTVTPTHQGEKEVESTDGSGDHDDDLLLNLLTTPVSDLLGTSIMQRATEVDTRSAVPESSTLPGFNIIVEEKVEQVEQEGLGGRPEVLYTTNTQPPEAETASRQNFSSHEDDSSQEEGSTGDNSSVLEYPDLNHPNTTPSVPSNVTNLLILNTTDAVNDTDIVSVNETETESSTTLSTVEVTLLPAMTPTPSWDTAASHTPPQESRADVEFSGDTPILIGNPEPFAESDFTAAPTSAEPEEGQGPSTTGANNTTTGSDDVKEKYEVKTSTHPAPTRTRATQSMRTGISGMMTIWEPIIQGQTPKVALIADCDDETETGFVAYAVSLVFWSSAIQSNKMLKFPFIQPSCL